jgi:hypothetical protein
VVYHLGKQERQCPQCPGELGSKVVQTDDTPVPVLDPEVSRTRTGKIWAYVGDAEHPCVGRKTAMVRDLLEIRA